MVDLLVAGGTVVTQDPNRTVLEDGAVAVEGDTIAAVGPAEEIEAAFDADRTIDAAGKAVIPGLVNAHTHVSDILLRGRCGTDRGLYDWLFNVKQPGTAVMTTEEHELAAALYCEEALLSGITTFVDNDAEMRPGEFEKMEAKFRAFEASGARTVYARGIRDLPPDEGFQRLVDRIAAKDPTVEHPDQAAYTADTDEWLDELGTLVDDHHGAADGRLEIWVQPVVVEAMTDHGLRAAYRFAEEHDLMSTIHTAEAPQQAAGTLSPIERLGNHDALGEHALLAHCVHLDERDVRHLAETDTRVAHNAATNMTLGNGVAPVRAMRARGVTVAVGTDNTTLSDTADMLADLRLVAMIHNGHHTDPGAVVPSEALEMATIEAARAVRKEDELGSLEAGKRADIGVVDFERARLTPSPDPVRALVLQAHGSTFDAVVCDGEVVVEDGAATGIASAYPDLHERAADAADRIGAASGLDESDHV